MGHSKKHKKEKKKHKKEKKRRHSSSSSSESEEEWVEKDAHLSEPKKEEDKKRDDWMDMSFGVPTTSNLGRKERREKEKQESKESSIYKPGQSSRELNPYWKDGGTGLPTHKKFMPVKDMSPPPLRKHRTYDERNEHPPEKHSKFMRVKEMSPPQLRKHATYDERNRQSDRYSRHSKNWRKPEFNDDKRLHERDASYRRESSKSFRDRSPHRRSPYRERKETSKIRDDSPSDQRTPYRERKETSKIRDGSPSDQKSPYRERKEIKIRDDSPSSRKSPINERTETPEAKILSKDEMNKLGARIIKAEIMGNTELAAKLQKQLNEARELNESSKHKDKRIVTLTETNSQGFTRPFNAPGEGRNSKKRRVPTHENRERVRYFADDDKHSLQDMFENEKFSTAADQNAVFANLMGKEMSQKDGGLALDDSFAETAATDNSSKEQKKKMEQTIRNQINKERAYDECRWCIMGQKVQQNLIVTTRSKVYLCVPPFQSLTENHCLIVPNFHVSCATQTDEDVWDDMMEMRKTVVDMFKKEDEDVIFFEHAANFHRHPHMLLHCVPVPKEIGDEAPIYFKKAMLECETEWSNNKKVVDLRNRDVKKAVPKGLPYFSVDFGMQSGYAHVIEDYKLFPRNFAQEIIGGMMDLDHGLWRKQRNDTEESVKKKRAQLFKLLENLN